MEFTPLIIAHIATATGALVFGGMFTLLRWNTVGLI